MQCPQWQRLTPPPVIAASGTTAHIEVSCAPRLPLIQRTMTGQDMQALLESILDEVRPLIGLGNVADYIPALADVPADQLGIEIGRAHV